MSLTGILGAGLSALQTNSAALRVISNNISNVNTAGYARRLVNLAALTSAGQVSGVQISDVQRVVDEFLNKEMLSASSSASNYDTQSSISDQINAMLGSPGDGTSLTSKLSNVFASLGTAALSPTATSSQGDVLNSLQGLASTISSLSTSLSTLQSQTDSQVANSVTTINNLLTQIFDLNKQIKIASASGNTDSSYLDQLDVAVQSLSQQIDVRATQQPDGSYLVTTLDGTNLVGDTYSQLSYQQGGTNGVYQPVQIQNMNPATMQPIGTPQDFTSHLQGGALKGMITMRDGTLADLQNELGSFAQSVAQAFNAQHNANSAYPPPTSLDGRDTGLLSTDALNFTGKTTIALTDSGGTLQHTIAVDFGAGTISVDGGTATSFGNTIGGFASTLNTALGTVGGSATFANGQLTLSGGTDGVVVSDQDSANPSSRGGTPFSQFFGLNDLFTSTVPSITATGLSTSDQAGSNGEIDLQLRDGNGSVLKSASVSITSGMTMSQVVGALNTALNGYASFTLNSDGSMSQTVSSSYPGYNLQVSGDTTARGTTGVSLTALFGIGANQMARQAVGFAVTTDISNDASRLAFAKPDFTTSQIVGAGDSTGLQALQNIQLDQQSYTKVGALGSQSVSLGNYAGAFYQDVATRSATIAASKTTQDDRLTEATSRQQSASGVNLDEELSNMMIYQQAYSAGARLLTVADQMFNTLLQIQ
ncbi:MAG: flagellar hook-associated protein FlgK [Alphaproteobacteria bacterium]|nr:flagellar hook-associated protein FlgK [Alphaproteobacteria bacterium]